MVARTETTYGNSRLRVIRENEEPIVHPLATLKQTPHGLLVIRFLSEDEIATFAAEKAKVIAKHDPRATMDVQAMFESLQRNPLYHSEALGTTTRGSKRVTDRDITIDYKTLHLHRLDPRNRPDIPLLHPASKNIRVVYAIDTRESPAPVLIKDVMDHKSFDRKYA